MPAEQMNPSKGTGSHSGPPKWEKYSPFLPYYFFNCSKISNIKFTILAMRVQFNGLMCNHHHHPSTEVFILQN